MELRINHGDLLVHLRPELILLRLGFVHEKLLNGQLLLRIRELGESRNVLLLEKGINVDWLPPQ